MRIAIEICIVKFLACIVCREGGDFFISLYVVLFTANNNRDGDGLRAVQDKRAGTYPLQEREEANRMRVGK